MCQIKDYDRLEMTDWYRRTVKSELAQWHKFPVTRGGTILDIGAGCGETAQYYLLHGAGRVIAIEQNPSSLEYLHRNFDNDPRVVIVEASIDNIKIDIDGAEKGMVLETHFPFHWRRLWAPLSQLVDANLWILEKRRRPFFNLRYKRHLLKIRSAHMVRLGLELLEINKK